MKQKKIFRALAIISIITLGIISCAQDELTASKSSGVITKGSSSLVSPHLSLTELNHLQNDFKNIMLSSQYNTYITNLKAMVTSLNSIKNVPLDNRSNFQTWITINLSSTTFISVTAAMSKYDNLIDSASQLYTQYASFYMGLDTYNDNEVEFILSPGFYTISKKKTNPCLENCYDICLSNLDALDAAYAGLNFNTHLQFTMADHDYWSTVNYIVGSLNNCVAGC